MDKFTANQSIDLKDTIEDQIDIIMSLFSCVTQGIINHQPMSNVLTDVLALCLETFDFSKGAIYFKSLKNGDFSLKSTMGFEESEQNELKKFFDSFDLLLHCISTKEIVSIPSASVSKEISSKILQGANSRFGFLIPLLSPTNGIGVMFLASENIIDMRLVHLFEAIGVEIGHSIGLFTAFDITKSSEERYRMLLDKASSCIFIADFQGVILEVNKQGEKLLGCPKSEILGKKFKDFFTSEYRAALAQWTQELSQDRDIRNTEVHIQRPNGEVRTIEGTSVKVDIGGESLVHSICIDVTERNMLRTKALLQDKLATVGLLSAGVAHEINNPIAWVLSNLNFLNNEIFKLHRITDQLTQLQQELEVDNPVNVLLKELNETNLLDNIAKIVSESIEGASRIQKIVQDLKGYSKESDTEMELTDMRDILNSAINMSMPQIKTRARFKRDYDSKMPLLHLNNGKLHQVFLNLLVNAAQAIEEGDISHNEICVATRVQGHKIIISIADTGHGIAQDLLPKIFDPFFSTKPVGSGLGLGLFICHEIIQNMGGELSIASVLNEGTTVTISLPMKFKPPKKLNLHSADNVE